MNNSTQEIYEKAYSKYYSPNNKIWSSDWDHEIFPFGGGNRDKIINRIKSLIEQGFMVKCGYTTSSIRSAYNRYIFYKARKCTKCTNIKKK